MLLPIDFLGKHEFDKQFLVRLAYIKSSIFKKGCFIFMDEKIVKAGIVGISSFITYISQNFTPLIFILILLEVMDYITGIVSAKINGELTGRKASLGFIKKVFYFFLIAVAFCFDYVISYTGSIISMNFGWPSIFGVLSVSYLCSTEAISILENLSEIGIKVPFLTSALKSFRVRIEEKEKEIANNKDEKKK